MTVMASPLSADADPDELRRAKAAMARLERAEAAVEAARLERDEAIIEMLEHGVSLGRVARQLGMSRALVQQTAVRVVRARARRGIAAAQQRSAGAPA
jgi:hypothetical protein